jgi:hypothetical protein
MFKLIEVNMRGSIRTLGGFLIVFGAVGGMDSGEAVLPCLALAIIGLYIMYSGVTAMNRKM